MTDKKLGEEFAADEKRRAVDQLFKLGSVGATKVKSGDEGGDVASSATLPPLPLSAKLP